jgi:hypothetical protein
MARDQGGLCFLFLLAATWISSAPAQIVDTARISGIVQDSFNARIASAKIQVRSKTTAATLSLLTSNEGVYFTPPIPPGDYDLRVEAKGFASVIKHIYLEVAQHLTLDLTLKLGETNETIEVKGVIPLLESQSGALSNERTETAVKNLPLNGRNFAELMGLTAGVINVHTQLTGILPLAAERGDTSYSVNGLRAEENQFLIDGINNNENHVGLSVVLFPPIDAVQEFRMETSAADARYGHGGGGTVNLVFKSGTSRYHGDVFEFLRNSGLDARNFFDRSKPGFHMNQFGATFGGPVRPGHKDPRTFFFADYEGARIKQALTYISTVPTAAMRGGDFSKVPQRLYDPSSQEGLPGGGFSRTPFADNIVSTSLIDSVGSGLIDVYPLPNLPGIANNYLYQPFRTVTSDEGDIRVDHHFSNADSAFVRFSQARADVFQPGPLPPPAAGGTIAGAISQPAHQAVISDTHLFTPTTVNIARFGWSRVDIVGTDINQGQSYAQQIGIPGSNIPGDPRSNGLPFIAVTGAASLGTMALPAVVVTNNYQLDENLSLVRGRHVVQIGGDVIRRQYNDFQTSIPRGMMRFTTDYSSNPAATAGTGLGFADLLMGKPISGTLQFIDGTRGLRRSDISAYIQDDYKASDKLTVNIGLRYENYIGYPWTETHNRAYNFAPPSGVVQVGTKDVSRSGLPARNANFMPRAGAAWRIGSNTVLRAAYGILYSAPQIIALNSILLNPPELIGGSYTNDQFNFGGATPASSGFERSRTVLGSALNALEPDSRLPYTQQWNAGVQHQFGAATLVSATYLGTAGTHLQGLINVNQPIPGLTPIAGRRPYPVFQNILEVADVETSRYQALQLTAEQRLAHGLSFNASYTWSHALDYASAYVVPVTLPFMDTHNRRLDYGNADFDVRHRLVASATYALPFQSSGFRRRIVRGWQMNGIFSLYAGLPFTVQSATNSLNIAASSRASYIGTSNGSLPESRRSLERWFDIAAFSAPASLQFGNVGRNTLSGPGTKELDFSVFKNISLAKDSARSLQFRAESFNLTNTPQFNNPVSTIGAPGAGAITSAGSPNTFQRVSREVQLALKLYF